MEKKPAKPRDKWVKVFLELMMDAEELPREEYESPCNRCPLRGLCG